MWGRYFCASPCMASHTPVIHRHMLLEYAKPGYKFTDSNFTPFTANASLIAVLSAAVSCHTHWWIFTLANDFYTNCAPTHFLSRNCNVNILCKPRTNKDRNGLDDRTVSFITRVENKYITKYFAFCLRSAHDVHRYKFIYANIYFSDVILSKIYIWKLR